MPTFLAVLAGALLFLWPAFVNGYPLLFSDTGGLLAMALEPTMGWDKPWVYGPFLLLLHGRTTLWLAALGQALLLSHVLWLAAKAVGRWSPGRHAALCAALALLTAAPWFASLLMPDIFAPMVVLCTFALAWPERLSGPERGWLAAVGTLAVAVHLAHLILAAGCIALALIAHLLGAGCRAMPLQPAPRAVPPGDRLRRWRAALPLAAALALLLLSNLAGNGVLGVSPYGSVFMLARLVADGPAREVVDARCPAAGWHLCGWKGKLNADSDAFLWAPEGPVWDHDRYGPILFAPEAGRIVRETVLAHPVAVAEAMALNTARQLPLVDLGDTLGPDYLDLTVLPRLERYFPAAEVARYRAALQPRSRLRAVAAPLLWPQRAALLLGLVGTLWALTRWRREPRVASLALLVLGGLLANAFATGALSGPHNRYQARIAWLLLVPPLLMLPPLRQRAGRPPRAAGAPTARNPAAAAP
jgi:hypothetical protein